MAAPLEIGPGDVADIALGGAFLACGGGGDVIVGRMVAKRALHEHGACRLLPLSELADDATVISIGGVGAPSIMAEKVSNGSEAIAALRMLEEHIGRRADALIAFEAGGSNSLIPLSVGAELGLPVLDADGMGRAFPEMQMETFSIYGVSATPLALCGNEGNRVILEMTSAETAEQLIRHFTVLGGGGVCYSAEHVMRGEVARRVSVGGTITLSLRLGCALRRHRGDLSAYLEAIRPHLDQAGYGAAEVLFEGKVVDVDRRVVSGYDVGTARVESFGDPEDVLLMDIQNEFLTARRDGAVLASVPDLICVLDNDSIQPITQENLGYGQRVTVLGIGAPAILRTERALEVVSPRNFGLDFDFVQMEERLMAL